jgi:hypothetical protein
MIDLDISHPFFFFEKMDHSPRFDKASDHGRSLGKDSGHKRQIAQDITKSGEEPLQSGAVPRQENTPPAGDGGILIGGESLGYAGRRDEARAQYQEASR